MSARGHSPLPPWWRAAVKRLEANARECDRRATIAFRSASLARDSDDALGFVIDGVIAIGEARGHRNALYELTQDGAPEGLTAKRLGRKGGAR